MLQPDSDLLEGNVQLNLLLFQQKFGSAAVSVLMNFNVNGYLANSTTLISSQNIYLYLNLNNTNPYINLFDIC